MPKIQFSQDQILSGDPLDAGWYTLTIVSAVEALANDKESYNWVMDFKIAEGPKTGVPIRAWLSEKPMGMAQRVGLVRALAGGKAEAGKDYGELSDLVGRKIEGYCVYDTAFKSNKVEDFRPVKK